MAEPIETKSGDQTPPKADENTNITSKDELTMLKETISSLADQVKNQSFIIGKLSNAAKKTEKVVEVKQEEIVDNSDTGKFSELEQKIVALQKLNEAKTESVKKSLIARTLAEAGVDSKASSKIGNFLAFELGNRLKSLDSENGEMSLAVVDGEKEVPLQNYIKMYLESDEGSWAKPSRKGPTSSVTGNSRAVNSSVELSASDFSKAVSQVYADCKREGLGPKEAKSRIAALKMKTTV